MAIYKASEVTITFGSSKEFPEGHTIGPDECRLHLTPASTFYGPCVEVQEPPLVDKAYQVSDDEIPLDESMTGDEIIARMN